MAARLELRAVTKRYGGVLANDAIGLAIAPGEIHAVLGENGAGKSTLMKIVYGALRADSGEILWQGRPVSIPNPAAARRLGIGMVYQHFSLFETLTVVENMAVALPGRLDLKGLTARIAELGERHGLVVDPHRRVHHLSVGERQRVEILRCLLQSPQLLILDEPTSVLPPTAVRGLFAVLRGLVAEGRSVLYISHKLEEVRELCDSATVLRGGRVVGRPDPRQTGAPELARLMVGATVPGLRRASGIRETTPRLELRGLSVAPEAASGRALDQVSLSVHGGEVVGVAGVSGNGQAELLAAVGGERRTRADAVLLDGIAVGDQGVAERRTRGLALVPEERLGRGAAADLALSDNALLTGHRCGLVRRGLVDLTSVDRFTRAVIGRFGVACAGPSSPAGALSGGNLQKFIVGRELSLDPRVLIVAQPTWGVDAAAAASLRQRLIDSSRRGAAVLVISEDLEELFGICDRLAVIHGGRLSPAEPRAAADLEAIGMLMAGAGAPADAVA